MEHRLRGCRGLAHHGRTARRAGHQRVDGVEEFMSAPSDAQLNERLREMCGEFVPWDKFAHVRSQLRQGRTYFARRYGDAEWQIQVGFLDTSRILFGKNKFNQKIV